MLLKSFYIQFVFLFQIPTTPNDAGDNSDLSKLARVLRLYSCGASELISAYYHARLAQQRQLGSGVFPCGSVSVRVSLSEGGGDMGQVLRVEVLNARHLKPGIYSLM